MALGNVSIKDVTGNIPATSVSNEKITGLLFDTSLQPKLFTEGYGKNNLSKLKLGDVCYITSRKQAIKDFGIIERVEATEEEEENNAEQSDMYAYCPIFVDKRTGQPNDLYNMLQEFFEFIKIATPALVIVLSTIDYLGAIAKSNDDEVKKANKRTIKRVIIGLAIFFLPFLLDIVFRIFGLVDVSRCGIG